VTYNVTATELVELVRHLATNNTSANVPGPQKAGPLAAVHEALAELRTGKAEDRDAGIRKLQACVLVANDADIAGYTLSEVQEATETIIASPDEPGIPKLKRMFQAALTKAAAARQQAQLMGSLWALLQ
jgi:hypothetical protein